MSDEIAPWDKPEDTEIIRVQESSGGIDAVNRGEVESQLSAAHRYPRSITKFMRSALSMATISREVAESCIYALPRGGKTISGPSIRLAEICASAFGNLHVAARIIETGEKEVVAQGGAWDLEANSRATVESRRRITDKNGKRYNDDMILMTANAAASIALRNAIFRVVPRAYVDTIFAKVKEVAVGKASTLVDRRAEVLARLAKLGATQDRVMAALELKDVGDIGLDQLEVLIGYGTAIKSGDKTVDEVFPGPAAAVPGIAPAEQGRRVALGRKPAEAKPEPTPPPAGNPNLAAQVELAQAQSALARRISELGMSNGDVAADYEVAAISDLTIEQAQQALSKLAAVKS